MFKRHQKGFIHLLILLTAIVLVLGCFFIIKSSYFKKIVSPLNGVLSIKNTPFVSASQTSFYLNGQPYQFTGINAYELTTLPGVNGGCGGIISNVDNFFAGFRPNSVIRMWAFQGSVATNITTKKPDWTQLDKVVNSAFTHNQKLILVLSPQSGQCDDGHWKDLAWYSGGYMQPYNDDGRGYAPLSFLDYAKSVAARYKDSTAVAMYELVSEPEPSDCAAGFTGESCYTHKTCNENAARASLRAFYDNVGGLVKQVDPNHLIESGVMGNGQCGAVFEDYSYIHQSAGVDVASYHDYGSDNIAMPGDIYNGLQKRINQMKLIGKPLIVGEVGMVARSTGVNCSSLTGRYNDFKAKMDAQFAAGIAGFIPWDWVQNNQNICTYDINPGDPVLALLHDYPISVPTPVPTPSVAPTPSLVPTPTPTASPRPTPTPTPEPPSTYLGNANPNLYCMNIYKVAAVLTNGLWSCGASSSPINMYLVCQWQYNNNQSYAYQTIIGDPNSWTCYLPPFVSTSKPTSSPTPNALPVKLGGLDLSGYCYSLGKSSANLQGSTWICGDGAAINITDACQWQYVNSAAYAKQAISGNPFSWVCYK